MKQQKDAGSLLIEWHRWRKPSVKSDLFDHAVVAGWVSFFFSRTRLSERLRKLVDALHKIEGF